MADKSNPFQHILLKALFGCIFVLMQILHIKHFINKSSPQEETTQFGLNTLKILHLI